MGGKSYLLLVLNISFCFHFIKLNSYLPNNYTLFTSFSSFPNSSISRMLLATLASILSNFICLCSLFCSITKFNTIFFLKVNKITFNQFYQSILEPQSMIHGLRSMGRAPLDQRSMLIRKRVQ